MGYLIRYNGKFALIEPHPYEPERQTTDIAWMQIKEGLSVLEAYRMWFAKQRRISQLLQ